MLERALPTPHQRHHFPRLQISAWANRLLFRPGIAAGLFFVSVLCSIYLPDAGRGFVKDDVVWISTSRLQPPNDLANLLVARTGFFRPVVSASFAVDFARFGLDARGYGVTNILLLFGCVCAIGLTLRAVGASRLVAVGGALVWAFNFHGINMAVLWISGRTALWLCFWWALAAFGFSKRARGWPVAATILAMLSREEGFMLPAMLAGWAWLEAGVPHVRARLTDVCRRTWAYWLAAGAMWALRLRSGAMTPWNAPDYYTYQISIGRLVDNTLQYTDRSMTVPIGVILVLWLCLGRPKWYPTETRRIWQGVLWLVLAFVPTILLPSRSSLYALLPSVGAILALSAIGDSWIARAPQGRLRVAGLSLALLSLLLWPVYKTRNARYEEEARLASAVLGLVVEIARETNGGRVIVRDVRDRRPTAEQAFGTLAGAASALMTDGRITLSIDPPVTDLPSATSVGAQLPIVGELRVKGGVAERIR